MGMADAITAAAALPACRSRHVSRAALDGRGLDRWRRAAPRRRLVRPDVPALGRGCADAELTSVRDAARSGPTATTRPSRISASGSIASASQPAGRDLTGAERQQLKSHGPTTSRRTSCTRRRATTGPGARRSRSASRSRSSSRRRSATHASRSPSPGSPTPTRSRPPGCRPGALPEGAAGGAAGSRVDEGLAEAHTALAFVSYRWEWSFAAADASFRRAIALRPDYVLAPLARRAVVAPRQGRRGGRLAAARDRAGAGVGAGPRGLCWALNRAKRYDEAGRGVPGGGGAGREGVARAARLGLASRGSAAATRRSALSPERSAARGERRGARRAARRTKQERAMRAILIRARHGGSCSQRRWPCTPARSGALRWLARPVKRGARTDPAGSLAMRSGPERRVQELGRVA
jgi:hypothetical protein